MILDRRSLLRLTAAAALAPGSKPVPESGDVTAVLRSQTSALFDAVAVGDAAVWRKYLHDDCVYTSEDGEVLEKKALVEGLKALPAGVTGAIEVQDFRARVRLAMAVTTYVADERENYHGHALHCQYRSTDTWLKTPAGWRLLASQVLALRTDPPRIVLPAAKLDEYCGRYSLVSDVTYEIRRKSSGEGLEGQRNGRPATDLVAEAPDVLFIPSRPRYRYLFRRDPSGAVTGFAERREAWDLPWTRQGGQS